ncbi:unnamed protein product, partial [Lampetra fluviatilis]
DLMEQLERQDKTIRKLKRQLRVFAKKIGDLEGGGAGGGGGGGGGEGFVAAVQRMDKEFQGMLAFSREDEGRLIKNLIIECRPRGVAVSVTPCLPAYVLFMCVRYADHTSDDSRVRSLLTAAINGIKRVLKKRVDDFETVSFWLVNTCRFLHCLKQYSGEEAFTRHNTARQTSHCLRNFDLAEYRQVLSDVAIQVYQQL